jgi:DnaJ-class molecular chaperone
LGSDISLTALDGRQLQMRVPPGAKPGLRMRVAGLGMPKSNGSSAHGDLYVQLNMKVPALKEQDLEKKLIDLMLENK